jgi:hypothetical protein
VQLSVDSLSAWLGAVGAAGPEDPRTPAELLVATLYQEELGRRPDPVGARILLDAHANGEQIDRLRLRLRASYEHFIRANSARSGNSPVFQYLLALSEIEGLGASPQTIAECIATYQYALGRWPDGDGFATFAAARARGPLLNAVSPVVTSAEAAAHHAPHSCPSAEAVAAHAASSVVPILSSTVSDLTLERLTSVERRVNDIGAQVEALKEQLSRIEVMLGFVLGAAGSA